MGFRACQGFPLFIVRICYPKLMNRLLVVIIAIIACFSLLFLIAYRVFVVRNLPSETTVLELLLSDNYFSSPPVKCSEDENTPPVPEREEDHALMTLDAKNSACLMNQAEEVINLYKSNRQIGFLILGVNKLINGTTSDFNYLIDTTYLNSEEGRKWATSALSNLRKHQEVLDSAVVGSDCSPDGKYCVGLRRIVIIPEQRNPGVYSVAQRGFMMVTLKDSRGRVVGRKFLSERVDQEVMVVDWGSNEKYFRILNKGDWPIRLYKVYIP